MTPRERVYESLDFNLEGRVPRQLWSLPWAKLYHADELAQIEKEFPNDITGSPGFYKTTPRTVGDAYVTGNYVDEWNCTWLNMQAGLVGEIKEPLIKDLSDLGPLVLPEEVLTVDREKSTTTAGTPTRSCSRAVVPVRSNGFSSSERQKSSISISLNQRARRYLCILMDT